MLITFFTKDGQFTTDKFRDTEEARNYLEEKISPIMIEDIESLGMDRAAIFIPNAEVSLISEKKHKKIDYISDKDTGLSEEPHDDPSKYETVIIDETKLPGWDEFEKLMLQGMSVSPEQELNEKDKKMRDSEDKLAYEYFKKNVDRLYDNPNWTRYKARLDAERGKNL